MQTCRDLGVTAVIELAPAGALTGIAKRELPGVELVAIKTPDDLDAARALIEPARAGQGEHTPEFRVVVTPAKGVFTRADGLAEGVGVAPRHAPRHRRAPTATSTRSSRPHAGVLAEWLRTTATSSRPACPLRAAPTSGA